MLLNYQLTGRNKRKPSTGLLFLAVCFGKKKQYKGQLRNVLILVKASVLSLDDATSPYVIKTPTTSTTYNYQVVFDDAQNYAWFEIDASQISNDAHIGISKFSGHTDSKWEIVLGGWSGSRSVLRDRNGGNELAASEHGTSFWRRVKDQLVVSVKNGFIEVYAHNELLLKHEDPSIKVDELNYLLVSSGWGASGTWTIKARKYEGDLFMTEQIL